jgi:hypothetical protein
MSLPESNPSFTPVVKCGAGRGSDTTGAGARNTRPTSKRPTGRGSWYFVTVFECPICLRSTTIRTRRYSPPKPADPQERMRIIPDACASHFL